MVNEESLILTLSLLREEKQFGHMFETKLDSLNLKLNFNPLHFKEKIPDIGAFIHFICNNYFDLVTITTKLDWQKKLWLDNELHSFYWMLFAKLDVELFFMKIRSIFDYVAMVSCRVSNNTNIPKGDKRESFNKLRNWLINPKSKSDNSKNSDQELSNLIFLANWFDEMKNIRDSLLHQGGYVLVFPDQKKILVQVYKSHKTQISFPEIMFNENVVDFELYAGLYFAYITDFLENFAIIVENRLPKKIRESVVTPFRPYNKTPVIFQWIDHLLRNLQ